MSTSANPSVEWLREATGALRSEVHAVVCDVVAAHGAVGWLHLPDADETGEWLERELAVVREGFAHFALARIDGEPCGLGALSIQRAPVLARNGEVRKLMTRPATRGRGVATAILMALEGRARDLGLENLTLDVRGNNHGAMALYESLGWRRCGVVPDFIAVGDARFDQVNYVRALHRPAGILLHGQAAEGPGASSRR